MPSSGVITYDVTPLQVTITPRIVQNKLLQEDENIFDFVIVGAGAAGCVLANRLSEQEQWSVLLIEAGDFPQPTSAVPALYTTFLEPSAETWQYTFEKDKKVSLAYQDKQARMVRGKLVGGTSAINNMFYIRGLYENDNTTQFNERLFYESIEDYPLEDRARPDFPCKGELSLQKISNKNDSADDICLAKDSHKSVILKLKRTLRDAYYKSGLNEFSDRSPIGFGDMYLMVNDGQRYDMGRAFLSPLKSRYNFHLSKNTVAESIVLNDDTDKRAKGVNIVINNKKKFVQARKELILTGGAINNAKLLLLSGIGPKDYLQKLKIPLVMDLPAVGKNVNYQVAIPLFFTINSSLLYEEYSELDLIQNTFEYVLLKRGDMSNLGISDFIAFMSTEKYPNLPNVAIEHHFFKVGDRMLKTWIDAFQFHSKIASKILKANEQQVILMITVTLLRPKSLGEIGLNRTHFQGNPNLVGKFLSDPEEDDANVLINAMSKISNLMDTPSFQEHNIELMDINVPECGNYKFCGLHYVRCYIRNMIYPTSAVTGSLKRGPECDKGAVVKADFEVRHIRCLRVADASILPNAGLGNTVASDGVMAAHLTEILKEKWIKDYVSPFKNQ